MGTDDNSTSEKETTGKTMAQKLAEVKKRKGGRADAGHNIEEKKDDASNDEEEGMVNSAFAQRLKQVSTGQR